MFGIVVEALQHITVNLGKAGSEAIATAIKQNLGHDVTVSVEPVTGISSPEDM
jgi:hypothetical protein